MLNLSKKTSRELQAKADSSLDANEKESYMDQSCLILKDRIWGGDHTEASLFTIGLKPNPFLTSNI